MTFAMPGDYFDHTGKRLGRACASGTEGCMWAGDVHKLPWEDVQRDLAKERTGLDLEDVYLNAGLVAGRARHLLNIIQTADMDTYEDDQAVFTDFMYMFPELIILDYAQQMFGNARWSKGMSGGGCPFDRQPASPLGSLEHVETGTFPLFLHGPGKFFECLDYVADMIGHTSVRRKLGKKSGSMNSKSSSKSRKSESERSKEDCNENSKSGSKSAKSGCKEKKSKSKSSSKGAQSVVDNYHQGVDNYHKWTMGSKSFKIPSFKFQSLTSQSEKSSRTRGKNSKKKTMKSHKLHE
mmetsp:Transcript_19949/g.37832  ORF Transcript_19949/g.37832 Transcript_19949/m.37832 type:complete len:294 (-) Transcript_19949:171-1052(-)